ncbi:MAG: septum site-determining protein MinC [Oleiphilaceae bacterium]|jgi:septum site-determining protein MinC
MTISTTVSSSKPNASTQDVISEGSNSEQASKSPSSTLKSSGPCLKLKASLLPMTVLELHHYETETIDHELRDKTRQAPDFFENLPVVIDLEKLDSEVSIPFAELVAQCLSFSIKVVAVRGGHPTQQLAAKEAGLGVLAKQKNRPAESIIPDDETKIETVEVIKEVVKTVVKNEIQQSKIIHQPIRSGQQVYAADGDLIVLASVSAGAEILADGNIHVYGALRGRALAGVKGNTHARIFCHSLEAELVSIAGQYKISEDIDKSQLKKPTQVYLDNESLCFKKIEL